MEESPKVTVLFIQICTHAKFLAIETRSSISLFLKANLRIPKHAFMHCFVTKEGTGWGEGEGRAWRGGWGWKEERSSGEQCVVFGLSYHVNGGT